MLFVDAALREVAPDAVKVGRKVAQVAHPGRRLVACVVSRRLFAERERAYVGVADVMTPVAYL